MVNFRSETMRHGTLVLPVDRAREFVDLLGRHSRLQIVDMNAGQMSRDYKKYIQRLDEMERILRYLNDEVSRLPDAEVQKGTVDEFLENDQSYEMDRVEASLKQLHGQFVRFRDNNADLIREKNAAIEEKSVADSALEQYVSSGRSKEEMEQETIPENSLLGFSSLAGVLPNSERERFSRTLFRATRGNAYTHFSSTLTTVNDDQGKTLEQSIFVIYYQGTSGSALYEKIFKICAAFGAHLYEWPRTYTRAVERVNVLQEVVTDKTRALEAYEEYFVSQIYDLLSVVRPNGNSLLEEWRLFCKKEKSIYGTLNLFESSESTLRGEVWFPDADEVKLRETLAKHTNPSQVSAFLLTDKHATKVAPPTYFRTTEFTSAFQGFVNTYGVPRYKEANPAVLTCITLPFLFGIMYGDLGHGLAVVIFGSYLIYAWPKWMHKSDDETVLMIGGGRYMILLMGIFAMYAGLLYNEFLSLGMNLFGSRYLESHIEGNELVSIPDYNKGFPYPLGFDPIWKGASNEMLFYNSFKMKFAVIVGGVHMVTGIFTKGLNNLYFKDYVSFFFEFLPQLFFFVGLVGWMNFLIFFKWSTDESYPKTSIINGLINMFFFDNKEVMFSSQAGIQMGIVIMMGLCIPMMLLPKPLINKKLHNDKMRSSQSGHRRLESDDMELGIEDEEEAFEFGEELIHQMIESIEFVLGVLSNTASYLRLWALSLAHQQLALVFFNITILTVLKMKMPVIVQTIMLFFVFQVFAAATVVVMFCMDALECYLHALRLQWVEFQNKFFKADGYKFTPFHFSSVLSER